MRTRDGFDVQSCNSDCDMLGGCKAVNKLLQKVGLRSKPEKLAKLIAAALSPSALFLAVAKKQIASEQVWAHLCCRTQVCLSTSLSLSLCLCVCVCVHLSLSTHILCAHADDLP